MPITRQSYPVSIVATNITPITNGGTEGAPTDGGDPEGDQEAEVDDTKTYCFCDRVSYGEMIACDDKQCEKEWVRDDF